MQELWHQLFSHLARATVVITVGFLTHPYPGSVLGNSANWFSRGACSVWGLGFGGWGFENLALGAYPLFNTNMGALRTSTKI